MQNSPKINRNIFFSAVAVQIGIVLLLILFKLIILGGGTPILLKIEPVDPRDPLRGDYITFRYSDLSRVPEYMLRRSGVVVGDKVFSVLRKSGGYWSLSYVTKDTPMDGELFFVGVVEREERSLGEGVSMPMPTAPPTPTGPMGLEAEPATPPTPTGPMGLEAEPVLTDIFFDRQKKPSLIYFVINYGLEDYFIPEGTGRDIVFGDDGNYAEVVVADDGQAVVNRIFIDGKLWP